MGLGEAAQARFLLAALALAGAMLAGCASVESVPEIKPDSPKPEKPKAELKTDGKYYKDDGPPAVDEVDWRTVADAVPEFKPIKSGYNRPYEVFGVRYVPFPNYTSYAKQGVASWYGRRYHGRKTSSGEVYNMYDMTAAHTVLPIPSYVRVTRVDDGRTIVVRVNDRGPFLNDRVIDLSYVAARKLGVVDDGTAEVLVEAILPDASVHPPATAPAVAAEVDLKPGSSQSLTEDSSNYLQIGAFSSQINADNFASVVDLPSALSVSSVSVLSLNGNLYRVLIGPYLSRDEAERDLNRLHDSGMEALLKTF